MIDLDFGTNLPIDLVSCTSLALIVPKDMLHFKPCIFIAVELNRSMSGLLYVNEVCLQSTLSARFLVSLMVILTSMCELFTPWYELAILRIIKYV